MANITLVTASGSTVTPKDDGLIYEVFSPGNGLIYGGVVSIKDSSTLHITAGHGIVCGRKFTIDDADIPVVLSGSGTLNGRLYIHLDLADVAEPIALLVETGSTLSPEVRDSDVNINNGVYDINIATFTVSTTTIADLVNIDNHIAPIDFGTADISGIGDGSIKGAISELNADIATKASKEWTVLGGYNGGGSHSMPANYNEILFKINVNGSGVIVPLYIIKNILPTSPTTQQFRGGYWATATTGCMATIQASDEEFSLIACYLNGADVLGGTNYSVMYR